MPLALSALAVGVAPETTQALARVAYRHGKHMLLGSFQQIAALATATDASDELLPATPMDPAHDVIKGAQTPPRVPHEDRPMTPLPRQKLPHEREPPDGAEGS